MNLETTIKGSVNYTASKTVQSQEGEFQNVLSAALTLANGTADGQADLIYLLQDNTIGAGATNSHDLSGSLEDFFGDGAVFARVKAILLINTSPDGSPASEASLEVGGNANAFASWLGDTSDKVVVRPGGFLLLACDDATGYIVTAATGDVLDVTNLDGSNAGQYTLALIGATA